MGGERGRKREGGGGEKERKHFLAQHLFCFTSYLLVITSKLDGHMLANTVTAVDQLLIPEGETLLNGGASSSYSLPFFL